jgi:hypothetical protein
MEIAPSEFWNMEPRHFWWLFEAMIEEQKRAARAAGELTDEDREDLYQGLMKAKRREREAAG